MREGDIYCMNDPYLGGTHLPDIAVVMPVFARGRPLAFGATMTHHQDVGGMAPGSVPTNATEVFQEGIRLPALKLREGDKFNDTLLKILRRNVRIPDTFEGDLMAQVAACTVGARRLSALAETYGDNHLTSIFSELLDRSETMTREALRAIPAGTYRAVDFLDNDGIELDKRIRIEVAVTVADGAMLGRFRRVQSAGARPLQRGAVGQPGSRLLCRARHHGPDHPDQRRLLPADHAAPARRLHRQSDGTRPGQLAHSDDKAHQRHHPGGVRAGRARPGAGGQQRGAAGAGISAAHGPTVRATSQASWSPAAPAPVRPRTASTSSRPTPRTA